MSVATMLYQVKKFNQQSKAPIKAKFLKEKKGRQTSILSYTPRFQVELSVEASLVSALHELFSVRDLSLKELAMLYCYKHGVARIGRIARRVKDWQDF